MYYMYVHLMPVEANVGFRHPGTGVKGGCELGTRPRHLQKQKCSQVLSHLSSPFLGLSSWKVEPRDGIVG